jgi:hypothetical protein
MSDVSKDHVIQAFRKKERSLQAGDSGVFRKEM